MQLARPENKDLLDLLQRFVCVRVVQANGTDLSLFQFDSDLTFAAFFLNADRKIYGRYGSRPAPRSGSDAVSVDGFVKAMKGALALHAEYPKNISKIHGKRGGPTRVAVPEDFESLVSYRPQLDFETGGQVAASCMHCHQIGTARFQDYRDQREAIPEHVLFPWPMPDVLGLTLDVRERARIQRVAKGSLAKEIGLEPGDDIVELGGQAILSIADVQWVLHRAQDPCTMPVKIKRGDQISSKQLALPKGFRRPARLPFRYADRHLSLGRFGNLGLGTRVRDLSDDERAKLELGTESMAMVPDAGGRRGRRGRFGGRNAGGLQLQEGDVIVAIDGQKARMSESDVFAYLLQKRRARDVVMIEIVRDGERREAKIAVR